MARYLGPVVLALGSAASDAGEGPWTRQLARAGVTDQRIVAAMAKVDRADYLPPYERPWSLDDRPLYIGHGQTTSQPTLIAQMIQAMALKPGCRVLEVGTGSGYQTALLAELCAEVYSVEIVEPLAQRAAKLLAQKGYANAHVKAGDGYLGWPEAAPFDAVVVCASAPDLPRPLLDQLAPGGRLVIPVGEDTYGELEVVTRPADGGLRRQGLMPVLFVPLTGPRAARDREASRDGGR